MSLRSYRLDPQIGIGDLKRYLCEHIPCKQGRAYSFKRCYLDSHDWRLLKQKYYLKADILDEGVHLRLKSFIDNQLVSQSLTAVLPRKSSDLRGCHMGKLISPILSSCSLVQQVQLKVTSHPMFIKDKEHKIIAQLNLEIERMEHSHRKPPFRILWYQAYKGYESFNQKIQQDLEQQAPLTHFEQSLFQQLMAETDL